MQKYTEISQDEGLLNSLTMILDNDKTALSCSSGVAFPTANVQIGQLCFRTDENRLYQTKDGVSWVEVADLSKSFTQHIGAINSAISTQAGVIAANKSSADSAIALRAPIASPTLTGVPKAPTATAGDSSTQIATTAFVSSAVSAAISEIMGGAPSTALDTLYELGKALGDDANFAATMTQALATKLNLSGGTLTGSITAPSFVGALTGNATTATKLATARTINGVAFDGSANITIADSTKLPLAGGIVTGALTVNGLITAGSNGINTTKIDSTSAVGFLNGGSAQSIHTGGVLVSSAYADSTKIPTSGIYSKGKIHTATSVEVGSSVDGVKDTDYVRAIIHPPTHTGGDWEHAVRDDATYAYYKLKYGTSGHLQLRSDGTLSASGGFDGNASTATKLATARTIALSGAVTGTATSFDGSADISIATTAIDGSKISTGTIPAARIPTLNQNTTGSANTLANLGDLDALTGTATPPKGLTLVQGYNNGYPHTYGNSLRIGGMGQGEIYVGWSGTDGGLAPAFIRSKRDTATAPWSAWREIVFNDQLSTTNVGTATKLQTARAINGVSFDGTANITVEDSTKLPLTGGTLTGNLGVNGTITATNTITVAGDNTVGLFKKLIQCATTTDGGYLAVGNTAPDKGYVEIGTIDDADTEIVARKRTSANAILATVKILDQSNNSSFPGTVIAPTFSGALSGNANTATTLATARTINGTSFNGSADITTANWGTTRTLKIGSTDKSVDGSANVSWTLAEIGAAAESHTHAYLPLSGGTLSGSLSVTGNITATGNVTAYSDERIKEDVAVIENALTKVEKLNGVTFKRKDTLDRQTGLLAQEVEAVLPEAVTRQEASEEIKAITGDEEVLAVNYGALTGLLVESIKELSDKLKAQQELIDKQTKLIENLLNKVSHT